MNCPSQRLIASAMQNAMNVMQNVPAPELDLTREILKRLPGKYRGCLIKTKINEAINYFLDEASGYL